MIRMDTLKKHFGEKYSWDLEKNLKESMTPIAPGARVEVRDELWIVRRVDPSSDGGHLYTCDGGYELVRDK